jgi:tetratricopeptide (TPR) repeat protein
MAARYSFNVRKRSLQHEMGNSGLAADDKGSRSLAIRRFFQSSPMLSCCIAVLILSIASVPQLNGQGGAQQSWTSGIAVEANQQLFVTMCALDAAGFDADESTLAEMPSRLALRGELLKLHGPATEALRQFYRDHALADSGETLSRYITLALVLGPPPMFRYQVDTDLLPPDVGALEGFQKILVLFYQEAHLDIRWTQIEPEYNRAIARYQPVVRRIVTVSNAYLREILKPTHGRSFTVYVEPLVGGRTNFRNLGDRYSMAVGSTQIPVDEIQHAYLHFMLDPLPLRYRKEVELKSALLNIAARAPQLPTEYRTDFLAFADECLIKAVELRLRHLSPGMLEAKLVENDKAGFILVRPFVTQLEKFEKAAPAMTYYFPDMIAGIDLPAEQKRLKDFVFAPPHAAPEATPTLADSESQSDGLDRLLAEGDHEIALKDAAAASATFSKALEKYPNEPRATYGLAVASILSGDGERAQELFEQVVSGSKPGTAGAPAPAGTADPSILAWSHVFLGRIHDLADERDRALVEYRAALAIHGSPENARVAAQRGLDAPYSSHAHEEGKTSNNP